LDFGGASPKILICEAKREELREERQFTVPTHVEFGILCGVFKDSLEVSLSYFADFLPECNFTDFFTLFQRFSSVKAKSITYVQE
jgi:hypothetical protein